MIVFVRIRAGKFKVQATAVRRAQRAMPDGNRLRRVKRAIYVAPFGELADPRDLAELAIAAEERDWDGFFAWDHIVYRAPVRAVADPWVALAAVACATRSLRIGPLITR